MMGRFTRAVAALLVLSTVAVGVPVLLVSLVGNPYPDGGLTRLRCFGEVTPTAWDRLRRRSWTALPDEHQEFLGTMP